jgi:hypothetical protein
VNTAEPQPSLIQGEDVVHRSARALVGWVSPQEAIQMLLGRAPAPNEDTSKLQEEAASCRAAVERKDPYEPTDPTVSDHPFAEFLSEIEARPAVQAAFQGMSWRTSVVDLTKVLSFQKLVFFEAGTEYTSPARDADLVEICLPSEQTAPPLGAIGDPDGKGFTVSSLNPNLRIAGGQFGAVAPGAGQPSTKMQAITFFVSMGTSYLHVVRYRDRCFLRDGYHRAARLIRAGVTIVPCLFIEARSFEEVQTPMGAFPYEVLYGERPPALIDFWDNDRSRTITQLAIRKVIRIRGEEFVVPR